MQKSIWKLQIKANSLSRSAHTRCPTGVVERKRKRFPSRGDKCKAKGWNGEGSTCQEELELKWGEERQWERRELLCGQPLQHLPQGPNTSLCHVSAPRLYCCFLNHTLIREGKEWFYKTGVHVKAAIQLVENLSPHKLDYSKSRLFLVPSPSC